MKEKLNIAAILNDKPKGTKLYSKAHGICTFDELSKELGICCTLTPFSVFCMNKEGKYNKNGEVLLFPSKEMQDWSKFAWKKGDVLCCGVDNLCIFDSWANSNYTEFNAKYVTNSYTNSTCPTKMWSKETNEDTIKQYISKIAEIKGSKFNLSTLTIEKPKEFKPMDWCLMRNENGLWHLCQFAFKNILFDAVSGNVYDECIPYNDSTKHLLGTTDNWKGGNNE